MLVRFSRKTVRRTSAIRSRITSHQRSALTVNRNAYREISVLQTRKTNEELVLRLLHRHGALTRSQLMDFSGLPRTTLYDIVAALVDNGAVTASVPEVAKRKRGRPMEQLTLNPSGTQLIGIEFAQQAVRVAAANAANEIIGPVTEPHSPSASWGERVDAAHRLARSLTGGALQPGPLKAVGIGVLGPMAAPGDSPRADPVGVSSLVRERFGVPVRLDNTMRLAALAELSWGAASGEDDVLYLELSHEVGGGLVVAGALHRGTYGAAGELGHITVSPGGSPCRCGGVGCLQTVASVEAVLGKYRAAGGEARDPSDLVAAAKAGDRRARTVLAEAAVEAGRVLATLSNTVAPSLIVVGGELAEAGPYVMEPIERELETHVVRSIRNRMTLRPATLGTAVAALGAVALVLRPGGAGVRLPSSLRRPKAVEPSAGHPALGGLARSGPEGTRPDVRVGRVGATGLPPALNRSA
ncbi:ROK family protein [Streptomyces sp. NPDC054786]